MTKRVASFYRLSVLYWVRRRVASVVRAGAFGIFPTNSSGGQAVKSLHYPLGLYNGGKHLRFIIAIFRSIFLTATLPATQSQRARRQE